MDYRYMHYKRKEYVIYYCAWIALRYKAVGLAKNKTFKSVFKMQQ